MFNSNRMSRLNDSYFEVTGSNLSPDISYPDSFPSLITLICYTEIGQFMKL